MIIDISMTKTYLFRTSSFLYVPATANMQLDTVIR